MAINLSHLFFSTGGFSRYAVVYLPWPKYFYWLEYLDWRKAFNPDFFSKNKTTPEMTKFNWALIRITFASQKMIDHWYLYLGKIYILSA